MFFRSVKQKLVSRSSTESELIAVHDTYPNLHWINDLAREMSNLEMAIPILYQDNISTIVSAAQGLQRFNRMSHVNMRYFAIKQEIDQERIRMPHMPSENMISDTLTKCSGPKHRILSQRDLYMNCTDEEARTRAEELYLTPETPRTRTEKDSVRSRKRRR